MPIVEERASSVAEILLRVADIRSKWNPGRELNEEIWFRGHGRRRYELLPGLYRPSIMKYDYDEFTIVKAFTNYAAPFAIPRPESAWDWYFLAQHYRLPTRLLDWTESLLAATYFALVDHMVGHSKAAYESFLAASREPPIYDADSPAVWMMEAGSLNEFSAGEDVLYSPPDEGLEPYLWTQIGDPGSEDAEPGGDDPIAILPPRGNARMVAQQGTFTVHGRTRTPIDGIAEYHDPRGVIRLACIVLDRARIASLWEELEVAGIGRLALFPDLESAAEHVKWVYQSA